MNGSLTKIDMLAFKCVWALVKCPTTFERKNVYFCQQTINQTTEVLLFLPKGHGALVPSGGTDVRLLYLTDEIPSNLGTRNLFCYSFFGLDHVLTHQRSTNLKELLRALKPW